MSDIDFGLAWQFIDPYDGCPRQLRFRRNYAPAEDPRTFDGTGQLVAVIVDRNRPDDGDVLPISRPGVAQDEIEAALEGWHHWAMLTEDTVNLAEIRRRIQAAGLGLCRRH